MAAEQETKTLHFQMSPKDFVKLQALSKEIKQLEIELETKRAEALNMKLRFSVSDGLLN